MFYIVGLLKDKLGNYTVAFICAGIPPLIGALFMCFIYRVKKQKLNALTNFSCIWNRFFEMKDIKILIYASYPS